MTIETIKAELIATGAGAAIAVTALLLLVRCTVSDHAKAEVTHDFKCAAVKWAQRCESDEAVCILARHGLWCWRKP